MRVLGGQVHVAEVALLLGVSFLTLIIGYSLPLVAGIMLLVWPLLLLQLVLEWVAHWLGRGLRKWWRQGKPERPPRQGFARFIWVMPLITLTFGYASFVIETGKWV